ncbi:hypothetical protein Tco_0423824, partial [Tanacetum coccineum]
QTSCLLSVPVLGILLLNLKPQTVIMEEPALTENQQQVDVNFLEED